MARTKMVSPAPKMFYLGFVLLLLAMVEVAPSAHATALSTSPSSSSASSSSSSASSAHPPSSSSSSSSSSSAASSSSSTPQPSSTSSSSSSSSSASSSSATPLPPSTTPTTTSSTSSSSSSSSAAASSSATPSPPPPSSSSSSSSSSSAAAASSSHSKPTPSTRPSSSSSSSSAAAASSSHSKPTPSTQPSRPHTYPTPPKSSPSTPKPTSTPSTPSHPSSPHTSPTPPTPSPTNPASSPTHQQTPPSTSSGQKRVYCKNRNYSCYGQKHVCPASCPTTCEVDCVTCKPVCRCDYPGAVCQDPRFIGGDGITFYFHGTKDKNFCLITDPNLHINAHFIGKRSPNMTRDFTWVQSLGILFDNHRLFMGAEKTAKWDDKVDRLALTFDNEPIFLQETEGATWQSTTTPRLTITRTISDTNSIVVEVEGRFKINAKAVPITKEDSEVHNYGITSDDCFAHLDLGFKFYSLSGEVEGVLEKTYREDYVSKVNVGAAMPVLGGEGEYEATGLFAADCKANRFVEGGQEVKGGKGSLFGRLGLKGFESFLN